MRSGRSSGSRTCARCGSGAWTARAPRRGRVSGKTLKVTLTRSLIGLSPRQEATVRALGLRKIRQTVMHADTPTVRGMIAKVPHVLEVSHEA
ncbi:MAG: 50S ribosomal protein L30 [Candidatus Rokuibacteriota bacterium]|nr:MAG: 50S ribosomal protein L30 [Candidatus Rokubacteria bacterium]